MLLFHIDIQLHPGVEQKSREVQSNTRATLTCIVNGLTQKLDDVVWKKGAVDVTTVLDYSSSYVLSYGNVVGNSQTTTLQVMDAGRTDTDYVCVVTSKEQGQTNRETNIRQKIFSKF